MDNVVLRQNPAGGAQAKIGSTVTITVGKLVATTTSTTTTPPGPPPKKPKKPKTEYPFFRMDDHPSVHLAKGTHIDFKARDQEDVSRSEAAE